VRLLKWAGIAVGSLAALAVLAAIVLPYVLNLERYRTLLASRASRALGREVRVGALRVSFWPGIGAEAQGIRVSGAPGFGADPFLTADSLRVRLQLLPLLRGQVNVTTAVLERPHIRLERNAARRWNLADLFKPPPPAPAAPRPTREPPRPAKPPLLGALLLSEVAVKDGEMVLRDEAGSPPATLTLAGVDLTFRQSVLADPIAMQASARLGDDGGRIEAAGRILPEREEPSLDLTLTLREVAANPLHRLLLGRDSTLQLHGRVSGQARITGPVSQAALAGQMDLTSLLVGVGPLRKPAGEGGRLAFEAQRVEPGLRVSRLDLRLEDLHLEGDLRIPDLRAPQIIFRAAAPVVDLDRLLRPRRARTTWLGPRPAAAAAPPRPAPPGESSLPVQGRLRVADLRYGGLTWRGLEGELRYQGGVLRIPSAGAEFMRGRMALSGEVDFRPALPRVMVTTKVAGVATEPLIKALALGPWSLQSVLTGETALTFAGLSGPAALGSASGNGVVDVRDGRLRGYEPLERLAEVVRPILAAQGVHARLNEFQQITGRFTVDKGTLRTTDLTLTKAEGVVTAAGSLGLVDSALDFDVTVRLGRTAVDAKVTGTTRQPIVTPKLGRLRQRLEREIDKALPRGQGKGLTDLFKGFFGQ